MILFLQFFTPVVVIAASLVTVAAFLIGALNNPQGLMNQMIVSGINYIAAIFPSTPENLKIGNLISSLGDTIPAIGTGIISEIFTTISTIAGISLAIKIYKLLPFKAS